MQGMPTNRIVSIASVVVSLALAVLPVVADLDLSSTAGIIAGIVAVLGVTLKWLNGWQLHENGERQAQLLGLQSTLVPPAQPVVVSYRETDDVYHQEPVVEVPPGH
jgi:hypothetical protein